MHSENGMTSWDFQEIAYSLGLDHLQWVLLGPRCKSSHALRRRPTRLPILQHPVWLRGKRKSPASFCHSWRHSQVRLGRQSLGRPWYRGSTFSNQSSRPSGFPPGKAGILTSAQGLAASPLVLYKVMVGRRRRLAFNFFGPSHSFPRTGSAAVTAPTSRVKLTLCPQAPETTRVHAQAHTAEHRLSRPHRNPGLRLPFRLSGRLTAARS